MQKSLTFVLIGRSGSGKGTQAELLKKFLEKKDGEGSVFYTYAGKELRQLIKDDPESGIGKLVDEKVMKLGGKAPDFLAVWSWTKEFVSRFKPNQHIIVDGSPRTKLEAMALDEAFNFLNREIVFPLLIDVSPEEVRGRMIIRERQDDTENQIKNRLAYFEKYVVPAVEYYRNESKNKLIEIDGNPHDPNLIHKNIIKAISL